MTVISTPEGALGAADRHIDAIIQLHEVEPADEHLDGGGRDRGIAQEKMEDPRLECCQLFVKSIGLLRYKRDGGAHKCKCTRVLFAEFNVGRVI